MAAPNLQTIGLRFCANTHAYVICWGFFYPQLFAITSFKTLSFTYFGKTNELGQSQIPINPRTELEV